MGEEYTQTDGQTETRPESNRSDPCPGDQELIYQWGEEGGNRPDRTPDAVLRNWSFVIKDSVEEHLMWQSRMAPDKCAHNGQAEDI